MLPKTINKLIGYQLVGVVVSLLVVLECAQRAAGDRCLPVKVKGDSKKLICICNERQCDDLSFSWPEEQGEIVLVRSTESGRRFESSSLRDHSSASASSAAADVNHRMKINLNTKHQPIMGWGGSFTDAAGFNIANLSSDLSDRLLESYYGPHGLQYNFGRVPIGGSDFSSRAYSYDDSNSRDLELMGWALAPEDVDFKIPLIKKASVLAEKMGLRLNLIATPWSPPKWMKTNKSFVRGKLIDDHKIYQAYTNYLMKFYDAYEEHGIQFWGQTVQNEPVASNLPIYFFNSLQFNSEQQINFIVNYLGPALKARGYTKDKFKLMVGDDSLGFINWQVPTIMQDKRVHEYIAGLAFHWYTSGTFVPYSALNEVVDQIKDNIEFVIMTEACTGSEPMQKKVDLGSWGRGEQYATDIIEDLHRHTSAWIDWNMALNQKGGPNWSGNFVDSPIIVNSEKNEFYKQPMYYALAHFSRFFRPGSIRVDSKIVSPSQSMISSKKLLSVAVINAKTNHLIVNILNKSDQKTRVDIAIDGLENRVHEHRIPTITISPKSINTVVMKL